MAKRQSFLPSYGYIVEEDDEESFLPGYGYVKEDQADVVADTIEIAPMLSPTPRWDRKVRVY